LFGEHEAMEKRKGNDCPKKEKEKADIVEEEVEAF